MKLQDPTATWAEYSHLLCPECRAKMVSLGAGIKARQEAGKKIRVTDVLRITRALCPGCYEALALAVKEKARRKDYGG